jgi:hypothetical protein
VFEDYVANGSQHIVLRVLRESLPVKLSDTRERLNAVVEALGRVILKERFLIFRHSSVSVPVHSLLAEA